MPEPAAPPYPGYASYGFSAGTRQYNTSLGDFTRSMGPIIPARDGTVKLASITDGTFSTILAGEIHYTMTHYTYTSGSFAGQPRTGNTVWAYGHVGYSYNYTNTPMNTHAYQADVP